MNKLRLSILLLIIINSNIVLGQTDSSDITFANLSEIRMVSDGISRYSEPKISPHGTRILTTRNLDTLIYIDLLKNSEIVLLTGGRFSTYYWIDDSLICYQKRTESNSIMKGEIGRINVESFCKQIDFTFSRSRYDKTKNPERIPSLLKGKFDVYFAFKRDKMYRMDNGIETEITHEAGSYFKPLISNNEKRIIIQKNGNAYNFNFNGNGENIKVVNGLVNAWSPDDKYLLYFKDSGGVDGMEMISELYICTSDGKQYKQLTFTENIVETFGDWAMKTNRIVFLDDKKEQIYISTINIK